jgi:hypothetical protein
MGNIIVGVIDDKDVNDNADLILEFCQLIFEFLKKTLKKMRSSFKWMKNMEFEFCILCPVCCQPSKPCITHKVSGCLRDACVHFLPEKELSRDKPPRCYNDPTHANPRRIKEEMYSHWFPKRTDVS